MMCIDLWKVKSLAHSNLHVYEKLIYATRNWTVHPSCLKVTTTLSLLIKQNYPGTYVSVGTNGQPCELAVFHWHQCPSDIRDTVLDEFLVSNLRGHVSYYFH